MVYYYLSNLVSPPYQLCMSKKKVENEELIKYAWPEDVWFHVSKLPSAHVFLRLREGETLDDVPQEVINDSLQLVTANSIEESRESAVDCVYTLASNLKKTGDMDVGQVGFHKDKLVRTAKDVEKKSEIIERLEKTKTEDHPDFAKLLEDRNREEPEDLELKARLDIQHKEKEDEEKVKAAELKISAWDASWNVNNSLQGMFVLGFPYAVSEGGYWTLLAILGFGVLCWYTGQILVDCLYEEATEQDMSLIMSGSSASMNHKGNYGTSGLEPKIPQFEPSGRVGPNGRPMIRVRRSYVEVAQRTFGNTLGEWMINFSHAYSSSPSQLTELLMTCAVYIVLCGDLFIGVFPNAPIDIYGWILVSFIFLIPYAFLKDIKHVSYVSCACMAVHIVMIVVILGYCFLRFPQWQWSAVQIAIDIRTLPLAIGLILSSNVAQIFCPILEENMENKAQFRPMLKYSFCVASLLKFAFAWIPFLAFGVATKEVITNNLPTQTFRAIVNGILIVKALLTYPLPFFTALEVIDDILSAHWANSTWGSCLDQAGKMKSWASIGRVGVLLSTLLMALFVPHFSILMSFIGSFTGSMLALVWPAMIHLNLRRKTANPMEIIFDLFLIVLGLICCVLGMYYSAKALHDLSKGEAVTPYE